MPNSKDYWLSVVRTIAMFSIIFCHVCQYYDLAAAWWLNMGVQVFLALSGYLFGGKSTGGSIGKWYWKRFKRIYCPYVIVLICLLIADSFVVYDQINAPLLLLSFTCLNTGNVPNGEHLWYITVILACYLFTPYLMWLRDRSNTPRNVILAVVSTFSIWVLLTAANRQCFWSIDYALGFFLGALVAKNPIRSHSVIKTTATASFVAIIGAIALGVFVFDFKTDGLIYRVLHVAVGVFAIAISQIARYKREIGNGGLASSMLDTFDAYSYEVYLTHQVLILGSFSVFAFHGVSPIMGIVLVLVWSFTSGFVLHHVSEALLRAISILERGNRVRGAK